MSETSTVIEAAENVAGMMEIGAMSDMETAGVAVTFLLLQNRSLFFQAWAPTNIAA